MAKTVNGHVGMSFRRLLSGSKTQSHPIQHCCSDVLPGVCPVCELCNATCNATGMIIYYRYSTLKARCHHHSLAIRLISFSTLLWTPGHLCSLFHSIGIAEARSQHQR